MKASRRQQLRTNELAQSLADLIEFFKANSSTMLVGIAGVVLAIGLGIYWYTARASAGEQGWSDFYGSQLVGSPDGRQAAVRAVATQYKRPAALAAFAWLTYGSGALQQAMSGTRSPDDMRRLVSEASKAYQTIINEYPDQVLAVAGARFKLAGIAESNRRWNDARKHYQAVIDDPRFADMPQRQLAIEAQNRLEEISHRVVFARAPATAPTTPTQPAPQSRPAGKGASGTNAPGSQPSTRRAG